ncbi:MAG TPA: NRDE family protein, partial [Enhygromyxa sp.]|nr:NRDE family protein [Enhygromyxa sp.]
MCTIIAALQVWPGRPLVVAANRDEALDRPAIDPRVWAPGEVAARRVLAPRDLRAGGTWLGVNDAGLFVGITNRRAIPDPRRRSRGELVFEALGA